MTTLEQYFNGKTDEHKFVEGDEIKINDETIDYMVVCLKNNKFAAVRINGGESNGYSCSKIIETEHANHVTCTELADGIHVIVRKLTDIKTQVVYELPKPSNTVLSFGKKFYSKRTGKVYTIVNTRSSHNEYVSIVDSKGKPTYRMIPCAHSGVSQMDMRTMLGRSLDNYTIVE